MKHVLIFLIGSIILFSACASEMKSNAKEIPTVVMDSFKLKFPNVYLPDWTISNKNGVLIYVAKWRYSNHKVKVKFLETGQLLEQRQRIAKSGNN